MTNDVLIHATTISLGHKAIVLRGPSGSGKSELALQLLETAGHGMSASALPAMLISDDQTRLSKRGRKLFASAPPSIKGRLEVRGFGIITVPVLDEAPVVLVVDLVERKQIERLPDESDSHVSILDVVVPRLSLDATSPGAASRIRVAVVHQGQTMR